VEKAAGVPAWMVSFSDMMTNMLCFFILMLALANRQEAGFVASGVGSHLQRIEAMGLPGLMPSTRTLIPQDSPLAQYRPPKVDPLERDNWVEYTEKMIRAELDRLNRGEASYEARGRRFPIPLGLTFSRRSDRLTLKDRRDLDVVAPILREQGGTIEVEGTCGRDEGSSLEDRLRLSLQRALAVVRYLEEAGVPSERLLAQGGGAESADSAQASRRKVTLHWKLD